MNATPETEKMSAGQTLKIAQQFVDAKISPEQAQAIVGSGVIKLLCHGDMEKYDSWKVAQALGLCEPKQIPVPSRDELLTLVVGPDTRKHISCPDVPNLFFGNRRYDMDVALFPFGARERRDGVVRLATRLDAIGYSMARFNEMVAFLHFFEVYKRLHDLWPLVPDDCLAFIGSLRRCRFDGNKTGFPWGVNRGDTERCIYICERMPEWAEPMFILGVKRIGVAD